MSKISPRDAWAYFTPATVANQEEPTCGRLVIDTAERADLYLKSERGRRLDEARKIVPDGADSPEVEVHRALLRLVTLDGFPFSTVFAAFHAVEGFAEALPDGRYRDPQRLAVG